MQKEVFERLKNQPCKLVLKPNSFILHGFVRTVFDDCFEFETDQKTSFIDFDNVSSIGED